MRRGCGPHWNLPPTPTDKDPATASNGLNWFDKDYHGQLNIVRRRDDGSWSKLGGLRALDYVPPACDGVEVHEVQDNFLVSGPPMCVPKPRLFRLFVLSQAQHTVADGDTLVVEDSGPPGRGSRVSAAA